MGPRKLWEIKRFGYRIFDACLCFGIYALSVFTPGQLISKFMWKSDVFNIYSLKQPWKRMKTGHKWTQKFVENMQKGPWMISWYTVFCTHPEINVAGFNTIWTTDYFNQHVASFSHIPDA